MINLNKIFLFFRLIQCGYPEKLNEYSYDEQFPIRGQIFDKELGNLLKV